MTRNLLPKQRYWPEHGVTAYCDCPGCGYNGALAITNADGRMLYHCHAGCSQRTLWQIVRNYEPQEYDPPEQFSRIGTNAVEFVRSLWAKSRPAVKTPVVQYLKSRGIAGAIPPALRYLPDHRHKPTKTEWPVMLAAVVDAVGNLRALHRTYLARNGSGKAPVQPPRMTIGPVAGFACHLAEPENEIAVSEGIETGLSVQLATGIPTWAALSAGGLRNLILPPLPRAHLVTIAADADTIGIKSARVAAARWKLEGRQVCVATPPRPGTDFNDVLLATAKL
jgi:hypothetical protein